ncbi:MAG: divalent-cation tolerance protein CutA [Acidobacteriota bacterium]|nr:divalent-cation tolerance protein CutA [Acidobacteriota bacterium]
MKNSAVVVLTTVSNEAEAESLARKIVAAKLAACVQILPPMRSVYYWENAVHAASEQLLLIKTLSAKFDELQAFIQANHRYDTPEIIALEAGAVAENYLDWMVNYLKS